MRESLIPDYEQNPDAELTLLSESIQQNPEIPHKILEILGIEDLQSLLRGSDLDKRIEIITDEFQNFTQITFFIRETGKQAFTITVPYLSNTNTIDSNNPDFKIYVFGQSNSEYLSVPLSSNKDKNNDKLLTTIRAYQTREKDKVIKIIQASNPGN